MVECVKALARGGALTVWLHTFGLSEGKLLGPREGEKATEPSATGTSSPEP